MSHTNDNDVINIDQTRNFSIISHVDHGKTTLSDHLIAEGGLLPHQLAGTLRALDNLPEEQKRGISIESSLVTFYLKENKSIFLINLIDTPGHIDFSGKVAEALRLVDNGLILVDAVEGVMAQTRTVLKQAIQEKLHLALFINKVDRLITEMGFLPDQIKTRIETIIGQITVYCLQQGLQKDQIPNFDSGTVLLGSALDGWAIDIKFVREGNNYSDISSLYDKKKLQIPENMKISLKMKTLIINEFINPKKGQKRKFPSIVKSKLENQVLEYLHQCNHENSTLVLTGRLFLFNGNKTVGSIVRILSGTLKSENNLISSQSEKKTKIENLYRFTGSYLKKIDKLFAGEIGVVVSSTNLIPGDIIGEEALVPIKLIGISYVQNPVVSISIEPINIEEVEELQKMVKTVVDITPGLDREIKLDTGELVVYAVGTLQLDILIEQLKQSFEIEVSDPEVVKYAIPQTSNIVTVMKWGKLKARVGTTSLLTTQEINGDRIVEDENNNLLFSQCKIDDQLKSGIGDVFKQTTKLSPDHGVRLKNFTIILDQVEIKEEYLSYEKGLILGSVLIREALKASKTTVCEPYYLMEIYIPEYYLGAILQELQIEKSKIKSVETKNEESKIIAEISVKSGSIIADRLRQVSEGYAFWSYPEIIYKTY